MSNQEQIQVQQQIDDVLTKVSATEDLLAQEKQDGTQEEVQHLRSQLEQLYKERVVLREKENLLLRAQQGSEYCSCHHLPPSHMTPTVIH